MFDVVIVVTILNLNVIFYISYSKYQAPNMLINSILHAKAGKVKNVPDRSEAFFNFCGGAYTIFFAWRGRKYNICDRAPAAKVVLSGDQAKKLFVIQLL